METYSFNEQRINLNDFDLFGVSLVGDNRLRVVLASSNDGLMNCQDGTFFNLKIEVGNSLSSGDVYFENIIFVDSDNSDSDIRRSKSEFVVPHCLPGDANGDWNVTVSDFTVILNYILGRSDKIVYSAADLNSDGEINVADISLLSGLVSSNKCISKKYYSNEDNSNISCSSLVSDNSVDVVIQFQNAFDVDAMQFDFVIPDGYQFDSNSFVSDLNEGLDINEVGDGAYRVSYMPLKGTEMRKDNDTWFGFSLYSEAEGLESNISLSNIELSKRGYPVHCQDTLVNISYYNELMSVDMTYSDIQEYTISVFPNPVVDILHIVGKGDSPYYQLFTMGGRLLSHGFSSVIDFSNYGQGVYILKIGTRTFKVSKI